MTVTIPKLVTEHTIFHAGLKEKDGDASGVTEENPVVTSTRYAFEVGRFRDSL